MNNEKYRQLINRMENRKSKAAEFNSRNAFTPTNTAYTRTQQGALQQDRRIYQEKSQKQDYNSNKIEMVGRLPNSAKNNRNQGSSGESPQQFFKKNRPQQNKQVILRPNAKTEGNNDPNGQQKKITKQFNQFLYQQKSHSQSSDKIQTNSEYERLHQKLDHIQSKISEMKINLQKKKQQKRRILQNQKKKKQQVITQEIQESSLGGYVTQVQQHKAVHSFDSNPYSPVAHNIYYVSEIVRAYQQQKSLAREHLYTSVQVFRMLENSKPLSDQEMSKKRVELPRRKGYEDKKTVVFDLDETLIHCNENLNVKYDVKLPIKFPTGQIIQAGINIRPYCKKILQQLSKRFQIIVFTASHSCYASVVLDYLDPNNEYIHHRLFRQHCHATPQGIYIKDLRIMNRKLSDVVLVDNAAYSYAFQIDNGIPILPYYHGPNDFELQTLQRYIDKLILHDDVRKLNRNTFKFHQYPRYYDDPEKLVEDLYIPQR